LQAIPEVHAATPSASCASPGKRRRSSNARVRLADEVDGELRVDARRLQKTSSRRGTLVGGGEAVGIQTRADHRGDRVERQVL
jgi:hypothetical protein